MVDESPETSVVVARGRAMGTSVAVTTVGAPRWVAARGIARVLDLESRWTRFRSDSELSTANRRAGRPTAVCGETLRLVTAAVDAWRRTGGRFDPTVLGSLVALGYDRTFELLGRGGRESGGPTVGPSGPAPGCEGIVCDPLLGTVTIPEGVAFDAGGIGKGRAADIVAAEAMADGAAGVCVDLGGDVRVAGTGPEGGGWAIDVEDPHSSRVDLARVHLDSGAVATSSTRRRRWTVPGTAGVRHHIVDPATGRPADRGVAAATVVAANAMTADVAAKVAVLAGPVDGVAMIESLGAAGLVVTVDGGVVPAGPIGDFVEDGRELAS